MTFKKIASLVLAMLMLCSVLCACGNSNVQPSVPGSSASTSTPAQTGNKTYSVTIYGADGKPATADVYVKFLQDGEQVAMQGTNAGGVAVKELPAGDYTVELMFTGSVTSYYFDNSDMTLSATKTEMIIHLALEQSMEGETVYADGVEYTAYPLRTGNTYVTLKPGRNYFLYWPDVAGEYAFFTTNGTYKVGYYGGTHAIQSMDVGKEAPNNGTAISISQSMVSPNNEFVIGVDNPGEEDVQTMLCAVRNSDYIDTSIPKSIYQGSHALTPWTMPQGVTIKTFSIISQTPYNLVLDEATGFYHLDSVTGPLVVVFLGSKAADYIGYGMASYDTILQNSNVSAYFRNDEGVIDRGEVYSNCLQSYIGVYNENMKDENGKVVGGYEGGCIDRESGLYPLTEDLMYIIKNHGTYEGWWDKADARYIFGDVTVSVENAWLFMCGYLEETAE